MEDSMNNNLADVTLVIDRSGSMSSCQQEAENGINHFIETQKKEKGECLFSLVQFDTEYEFVHKGVLIDTVSKFTLIPRGLTALLDAVGRAINETGERLSTLPENDRPGLVVFVIVTDGAENRSREFNRDQIKKMIEHQQNEYNWQFTFLGANQDAFAEAGSIGISKVNAVNYATAKSSNAFTGASNFVARARHSRSVGENVKGFYTDKERESMN